MSWRLGEVREPKEPRWPEADIAHRSTDASVGLRQEDLEREAAHLAGRWALGDDETRAQVVEILEQRAAESPGLGIALVAELALCVSADDELLDSLAACLASRAALGAEARR